MTLGGPAGEPGELLVEDRIAVPVLLRRMAERGETFHPAALGRAG
jgi:hypothetical protein